jgi:hypothetical protein
MALCVRACVCVCARVRPGPLCFPPPQLALANLPDALDAPPPANSGSGGKNRQEPPPPSLPLSADEPAPQLPPEQMANDPNLPEAPGAGAQHDGPSFADSA